MRPNVFQKILCLIYLVLIAVICVFLVPFRSLKSRNAPYVFYDSIWSDHANIDLYRIAIYLVLLTIIFYLVFKYLRSLNELELPVYKKKAKVELYAFLLMITTVTFCIFVLVCSNVINQISRNKMTSKINLYNTLIAESLLKLNTKQSTREDFWYESKKTVHSTSINEGISNYWHALITAKKYDAWLTDYYMDLSNTQLHKFNINSLNSFKKFIDLNTINEEDIQKQKEAGRLKDRLNSISSEKARLIFFSSSDIKRIALICFSILFGTLYLVRPLFLFIKGILEELK